MKKTALLIGLLAGLSMSHAHANGLYLYGEAGYTDMASSKSRQQIEDLDQSLSDETADQNDYYAVTAGKTPDLVYSSSDDFDDTDISLGLGAGYRFHENVAVELGYRDIGETVYRNDFDVTGTDASGTGYRENTYESSAFLLRGVAMLPVTERFTVEGLLGVAYVDTDYSGTSISNGQGDLPDQDYGVSNSESGFTATYGIGASYAVTTKVTAYARWERIHDIDTSDHYGGIEVDTLNTGVRYHF